MGVRSRYPYIIVQFEWWTMFFVSRTEYKHRKANQARFKQTRLTQSKGTICQEMEYQKPVTYLLQQKWPRTSSEGFPTEKKSKRGEKRAQPQSSREGHMYNIPVAFDADSFVLGQKRVVINFRKAVGSRDSSSCWVDDLSANAMRRGNKDRRPLASIYTDVIWIMGDAPLSWIVDSYWPCTSHVTPRAPISDLFDILSSVSKGRGLSWGVRWGE